MFSTSHSVLLVLLVNTCFQHYAECDAATNPDPQDHTEHLHTLQTHRGSGVNEATGLCCFEFHKTSIAAADVDSVKQTRFDCTLPGVILTTKKGSQVCVDPEVDWVKQIISKSEIKEKIMTVNVTAGNEAGLCCFEFHKRPIPAADIVSVKETRFDCTLPGVILTTNKGLRVCADPEVDWVKQIIKIKQPA
ncbi:C-C motif chemokine 23-like isoform X4 [Silurus meridionalis]|uniref:C-C motif chemokine 23-like isoform X4 n=1 Tax=Silurus meridionalis TaxID=175797 RepID=UPI001EE9B415|nr:C-C motif chemokine 23-like isoform X4 [Silurus meridionalis]